MVTEAQKRANAKYAKAHMIQENIKFYPGDADILEYLRSQENKAGYIKQLIREDMEKKRSGLR